MFGAIATKALTVAVVVAATLVVPATTSAPSGAATLNPSVVPQANHYDGMNMDVSRSQVYPFVDNWADTTVLTVTATVPVSGEVQIINGAKHVFSSWPLTTTQFWRFTWDGTDSNGKLLPYGQYWARAVLDRDVGPPVTLDNRVQVLSEAINSLSLSYTHGDVLGHVTNSVQGKGMLTISRSGKVVYRKGLNWSVLWYLRWHLTSSTGHRLPPGKYTFTVKASGHQGPAKTVTKVFSVK